MAIYVSPVTYILARVRNAEKEQLESVRMPAKQILIDIAKCLRDSGYIRNYEVVKKGAVKTKQKKEGDRDSSENKTLILYLAEGEKIPKIRLSSGRTIKDTEENQVRLSMRKIKSPAGKISAAKHSAIRKAVIMTAIKRMTAIGSAPGK